MLNARSRLVGMATVGGPLALLGPAFVAAIAYIDPGNFATNITAGSSYGYLLIWVLVVSNLMAMLIQYLSAKAGIATGKSLPELCRDNFGRPLTRGLWLQAELVAIATDLAEVLGGAIALRLLFDLPLLVGGVITAVVAFALLGLQTRGARQFEVVITGMLLVVLIGFLYSLVIGGVDPRAAAAGLVPRFEGTETVLLATGMLGATVMPHVIYLHGALTQTRYVRGTEERAAGPAAQPAGGRGGRDGSGRSDQPLHAGRGGGEPVGPAGARRHDRGCLRRDQRRRSARSPRCCSGWPCWLPGSPPPGSGPCPVRW